MAKLAMQERFRGIRYLLPCNNNSCREKLNRCISETTIWGRVSYVKMSHSHKRDNTTHSNKTIYIVGMTIGFGHVWLIHPRYHFEGSSHITICHKWSHHDHNLTTIHCGHHFAIPGTGSIFLTNLHFSSEY